jgi:hypothetical protein
LYNAPLQVALFFFDFDDCYIFIVAGMEQTWLALEVTHTSRTQTEERTLVGPAASAAGEARGRSARSRAINSVGRFAGTSLWQCHLFLIFLLLLSAAAGALRNTHNLQSSHVDWAHVFMTSENMLDDDLRLSSNLFVCFYFWYDEIL